MTPFPEPAAAASLHTAEGVRKRFELSGLTDADAARLASMREVLAEPTEAFVAGFYDHLLRFEETALTFASREAAARLTTTLRRYFEELSGGNYDESYAASRMRIGSVHYHGRIAPKWYIGAYARYLVACLPAIATGPDRQEAIRRVQALVHVVFFDASIALETFGLLVERANAPAAPPRNGPGGAAKAPDSESPPSSPRPEIDVDRLAITDLELGTRAAFVGLSESDGALLRLLGAALGDRIEAVVDSYHDEVLSLPEVAAYFEDARAMDRVRRLQLRYWRRALTGEYDRAYALERMRVGYVHERIRLPPELYVLGLGRQLAELARLALEGSFAVEAIQALCRVAFFDLMLVLDAYASVRIDKLLDRPSFALTLLSRMPAGVLIVDRQYRIMSANHSLLGLLARDGAKLVGRDVRDALSISGLTEALVRVARGRAEQAELTERVTPGARAPHVVRVRIVALPDGRHERERRLAVFLDDVSLLLAVGDRAYSSEHRWRGLVSSIDGLVWEMDEKTGTIELLGGRGLPLLGLRADHFLARPGEWLARIPPLHQKRWTRAIASLTDERPTVEIEHRMVGEGGRTAWLMSRVRREHVDGRTIVKGLTVDVTERHRMRIALRDRLRAERILNDLRRRALFLQTPAELGAHACRSLLRVRGVALVACGDVDGELLHAWCSPRAPISLSPEWLAILRRAVPLEVHKGGTTSPITEAMLDELGLHAALVVPVTPRDQVRGALLVGFRGRIRPWVVQLGRTVATLLAQAIGQREIERRDEQRRKLEALGTLAAGVAHDFGNVLAAIQSQAEVALLEGAGSVDSKEELRAIAEMSGRGGELVRQILAFARPQRSGPRPRRFGDAVVTAVELVRRALPREIEIHLDVATSVLVRIDATPLERLLMNVCKNASEAMNGRGLIEVEVRDVNRAQRLIGMEDPRHVVELRVRDHGGGIEGVPVDRLIEPFFTTRSKGTGLGLTIVEAIVAAHDGVLVLEAAAGEGAVARVQLPAVSPAAAVKKSVIVLDDDLLRLDALRRELAAAGLEVTACSSAEAALMVLPEESHELAAIVLRPWDCHGHEKLMRRWPGALTVVVGRPDPERMSHATLPEGMTNEELVTELLAVLEA